jgi:hypothetical protein
MLKFLAAFIHANSPSGFYESLGLRFLCAFAAIFSLIAASFGLLIHLGPLSISGWTG